MAQYKNVLGWLESEYLKPAIDIAKKVVDTTVADDTDYTELKELENILEKALEYVRRHQN